jgi:phosphoglycolate phosphatase
MPEARHTTSANSNGFHWLDSDAYLFDIDGTVLLTRDLVHYNALNRAMREVYQVDTTIDGVAYHGKTDLSILRAVLERAGVSGEDFESNLQEALHVVRSEVSANAARIIPAICCGIPEVLSSLKSAGKLLGIASGNLESVGWHKIEAAGLRQFFSFGCFSDDHEMRVDIFRQAVAEVYRRLGPQARICFIGDTPSDIQAARQLDAHVVAVCTGTYKAEELACHQPDLCVSSCAELLGKATFSQQPNSGGIHPL